MLTHRFLRDQFRAYRMWILERPAGAGGAPADVAGDSAPIEYTFLDRHARRDWTIRASTNDEWQQYQVALAREHDLVLATSKGETLGWAWIGYEQVHLAPLGRKIHLGSRTGYLYDAFVRPAARGQGIGRGLVRARCARADAQGMERLLTHVLVANQPSLRALDSQGFRTVGRTVFVRALALRVWTREPLPTARHLVHIGASV